MPADTKQDTESIQPKVFEIRIRGHLDDQWTEWFGSLTITLEESGDTLLTGPVTDQAALYGLLRRVRDLGLPLVSVNSINIGKRDRQTGKL